MNCKIFITAAFIAIAATATADDNAVNTDTVKVINNANQITIQRTPAGSSIITINGTKEKKDYIYEYQLTQSDTTQVNELNIITNFPFSTTNRKREKIEYDLAKNIFFGITAPVSGNDALSTSIELGIGQLGGITYSPTCQGFSISTGVGFGFKQFSVKSSHLLASGSDRVLRVVPATEEQKDCSSRIQSFYFQIPVLFTQKIYRSFAISVGAIANFNTYTIASSKYHNGNKYQEETYKGLHQRPVTIDLAAAIGFTSSVAAYVKYTPMEMFQNGYGPKVKNISAGITLNF